MHYNYDETDGLTSIDWIRLIFAISKYSMHFFIEVKFCAVPNYRAAVD